MLITQLVLVIKSYFQLIYERKSNSTLLPYAGAFAMYLEPWHVDVFEFLDLRKNHGKVSISPL